MIAPKRIRLSRAKGWKIPPGTVNVARGPGRMLGNPFVVGRDGTAAECVHAYALLIAGYIDLGHVHVGIDQQMAVWRYVRKTWAERRGKDVACWCRLDAVCHGDVHLAVAANGFAGGHAYLHTFTSPAPRARVLIKASHIAKARKAKA